MQQAALQRGRLYAPILGQTSKIAKFRMRPILLALLLSVLLAGCSRPPDEDRIRAAIAVMEQAAEQREPRAFMEQIDADFVGGEASFDRTALHNLLRGQFLRNEGINVLLGPIDVGLQGDRATAKVTATLTGGSGGWLPERGAVYDIETGWKRVGGEWRCISASWQQR